jgi:4-amino-4-deoxychorismate lyase
MDLFFETVRIQDRIAHNLQEHTARMNRTRRAIYASTDALDLADHIPLPTDAGLYRCRIEYGRTIGEITLTPYAPRSLRTFSIVSSDTRYPYKSTDRHTLDGLFARRGTADDILIVTPDGHLRDTSIANIALKIEGQWLTPATPLLPGTQRERLLREGVIRTSDLSLADLEHAERFAVMNAMIGFRILETWRWHLPGSKSVSPLRR